MYIWIVLSTKAFELKRVRSEFCRNRFRENQKLNFESANNLLGIIYQFTKYSITSKHFLIEGTVWNKGEVFLFSVVGWAPP